MAESEQVVRLTGNEDIHAVRTILTRAQAKRLLVVVPDRHPAFQRLVRLKMLVRQAHDEGVEVALVSSDTKIRDLAAQVELSSFRTVEEGRKARRWRDGGLKQDPAALNGRGAVTGQRPRSWEKGRSAVLDRRRQIGTRSNWGEPIMLAGLVFGMMIVLSAVIILLLPSAEITVVPRQVPLESTFPVTVDRSIQAVDFGDRLLPGELVNRSVQGLLEVASSGRRDVPSAPATGQVVFINVTGQGVNIPAGTIVSSTSGTPVRFRTTEAVSVPAELNARATAAIEALSPGPAGNVGPLQINFIEGAAATVVRVLNEQGTQGGDVQQRAVVTAADKEQLRDQLRTLLLQQGRLQLEESLAEDQYLVPSSVVMEITAETFNGNVDEQLDVLSLDMRARISGVVVKSSDVERLALRVLLSEVEVGYRLFEESFNAVPGDAEIAEDGTLMLAVRAEGQASALIAGDQVRELVRGQPVEEAQAALLQRLPLAADPSIEVSPEWWGRMPYLPIRIFIRVGVLGTEPPAAPERSPGEAN